MSSKRKLITFDSIPGVKNGETCLTIYPPGTWMAGSDSENHDYRVFVGGGGYGGKPTLKEAKDFLLMSAVGYCDRRIQEAEVIVKHYTEQRVKLILRGLTGERKEPEDEQ